MVCLQTQPSSMNGNGLEHFKGRQIVYLMRFKLIAKNLFSTEMQLYKDIAHKRPIPGPLLRLARGSFLLGYAGATLRARNLKYIIARHPSLSKSF